MESMESTDGESSQAKPADRAGPVAAWPRMFRVHLAYLARRSVRARDGKVTTRWESDSVRLIVQAMDEAGAVEAARSWFDRVRSSPAGSIQFGTGRRDAHDVRLAEGSRLGPPIQVWPIDGDVEVVRL